MKLKPAEKPDEKILIVEISDNDLNQKWKEERISDTRLEKLLKDLQKFQPKLIGIDIGRDVPEPINTEKDHEKFINYLKLSTSQNIFAICVYGDEETAKREGANPPSPDLINENPKLNRVGFNNAPVDKIVGATVRRQFLTINNDNPNNVGCITDYSLSYLLATRYLEMQGIKIEHSTGENSLAIGNSESQTIFYPLSEGDASYQGSMLLKKLGLIDVDMGGQQILINYRNADFEIKDAEEITQLANEPNKKLSKLVKDRIVLIGYTGWTRRDQYVTPINPQMAGVTIHAHMVSQIINAVLNNRPLLLPLPLIFEVGWIFICSLVGGVLSRPTKVTIGILVLNGVCYAAFFMKGIWLPVVPSILVLALTPVMAQLIPRLFQGSIPSQA